MQKFDEKLALDSDSPQERRGFLKKLAGLAVASTVMGGFANLFAKNKRGELTAAFGEPNYIGSIAMFGGNFAPRDWALCNGQLMSISQNQALFSILGCTFGGDCRTTFALPDLRGRVPIHAGTGAGLTTRELGQRSGQETHTLTQLEMPSHTHENQFTAPSYNGTVKPGAKTGLGAKVSDPTGAYMTASGATSIYSTATPNAEMGESSVTISEVTAGSVNILNTGGSMPHNNMQPWLCVNFIICLQGLFPPRN